MHERYRVDYPLLGVILLVLCRVVPCTGAVPHPADHGIMVFRFSSPALVVELVPGAESVLVKNIRLAHNLLLLLTTYMYTTACDVAGQEDARRALRRHDEEVQRRPTDGDTPRPHPEYLHQLRHVAEQSVRREVHR